MTYNVLEAVGVEWRYDDQFCMDYEIEEMTCQWLMVKVEDRYMEEVTNMLQDMQGMPGSGASGGGMAGSSGAGWGSDDGMVGGGGSLMPPEDFPLPEIFMQIEVNIQGFDPYWGGKAVQHFQFFSVPMPHIDPMDPQGDDTPMMTPEMEQWLADRSIAPSDFEGAVADYPDPAAMTESDWADVQNRLNLSDDEMSEFRGMVQQMMDGMGSGIPPEIAEFLQDRNLNPEEMHQAFQQYGTEDPADMMESHWAEVGNALGLSQADMDTLKGLME